MRAQCLQQVIQHFHIQHGNFVDDDQIGGQLLRFVVFENLPAAGKAFRHEKAVNRLSLALRRFGQALRRPPRRRAQDDAQPFLLGQADNRLHDRRLAGPRAAGNDQHSRLQGLGYGFALPLGQLELARLLPAV